MIIEVRAKTVMHLRMILHFSMKADMRNKIWTNVPQRE